MDEYLQKEADSSKNIVFLENGVPKIPKIIERKQHRNYIEFHLILIQNQSWNKIGIKQEAIPFRQEPLTR